MSIPDSGDEKGAVRRAALDFVRSRPTQPERERNRAASVASSVASVTPRFSDLPQYRQVLAHQEAGKQLGIDNPFYRAHEGAPGATTVIDGRTLLNFASYDYLGFNHDPIVRQRAATAIDRYGISASASRLVAGERSIHLELERSIAANYGVDAAITFVSGYLTNVATIGCLLGPTDLILHDELMHNSALAGAQFSGATRRGFRHNDLEDLERLLSTLGPRHRRVLVVVEGLYSMDGDLADLPGLIRLRSRYGFWLMVDEAHGLGILGASGRGSFEHFGCDPRDVDIWMGTLSKTTASCGGYVAGSYELVALLKGYAGGFVYSVGMAPALASAACASFELLRADAARTRRLQANGKFFRDRARAAGLDTGASAGFAVTPVMIGDSVRAVSLSDVMLKAGVNVLPILFPAVPEGQARLRFFIVSEHTQEQMQKAIDMTKEKLSDLVSRNIGMGSIDPALIARQIAVSNELQSDGA